MNPATVYGAGVSIDSGKSQDIASSIEYFASLDRTGEEYRRYCKNATRLANDYSFTPVLVIVSEPIFRQEDKDRIVKEIQDLEYAQPPKVLFLTDQYEINKAIREEEKEITLLVGSSNEREIALEKEIQFILGAFPVNERLIFNRTYAGYRGSLTFTEDIYDNN